MRPNKNKTIRPRMFAAALTIGTLLFTARPAEAFRVWTLPFISESLPTVAPVQHARWDLREFPNCQIPYALSSANLNMIDFNGDGNLTAADQTAASNAVNSALASWANVTPAIIAPMRIPAGTVPNLPQTLDGFNVIGFGTGAGDDVADPAPVGRNVGSNRAIILPGPNNVINSVLNDTPAGGPGTGDDTMQVSTGGIPFIASGPNQIIETTPVGDDSWIPMINVGANTRIVRIGANTTWESRPFGDDVYAGNFITTGPDGIVQSQPNNMTITNTSVFGITGMLVNNTTGAIQETDIILNTTSMISDETNTMRPVPWRTNGQQRLNHPFNASNATGGAGIGFSKDVQATVTHELGHSLGIAHPEENQGAARGQGVGGLICITGTGGGNALSAATIANLAGDDEINAAMTMVYTGSDGICQTMAGAHPAPGGMDTQNANVNSGGMAPTGFLTIGVRPASDNNLTTPPGSDDMICMNTAGTSFLCVGANGLCNSGFAIGAIPTMNTNPNCFNGAAAQERSLSQDDQNALNFLYSWDLGDAPDPFMGGGPFNRYPTLVQTTTNGRTLNNVQLFATTAIGPAHILGTPGVGGDDIVVGTGAGAMIRDGGNGIVETTPAGDDAWIMANVPAMQRVFGGNVAANANLIVTGANNVLNSIPNNWYRFRYEWLGANVDGNANEHSPQSPDMFDDGFAFTNISPVSISGHGMGYKLNRGGTYPATVTLSHSGLPMRYSNVNALQQLYFNGYFDLNGDMQFQLASDRIMNWWGSNTATAGASGNLNGAAMFQAGPTNTVTLNYNLMIPANAGMGTDIIYARMCLDYGEDEGRVANISTNNGAATGVAQFGEVEDYAIQLCDPPDQLHIGCLPEYQAPSIPLGQAGTLQAWVERNFVGLKDQFVTIRQIGGTGAFEWPDGSTSMTNPSMTFPTDENGKVNVQIADTNNNPGDIFVEVSVAGTSLKTYCQFDIGFFGGNRSADLNGDGEVDTADLGILISRFGSDDFTADINGDGVVDTADLGILLSLF